MRRQVGVLICAVLIATGCRSSVESERNRQDERVKKDGKAAVRADYKRRLDEHPNSPEALYLYARLVEDMDEKSRLAASLTKDHPAFSWGWMLLAHVEDVRGDAKARLAHLEHAVELEPKADVLRRELEQTKSSTVIIDGVPDNALDHLLAARIGGKPGLPAAWCPGMFALLEGDGSTAGGLRIKGWVEQTMRGEDVLVGLSVSNNSSSTVEVRRHERTQIACWDDAGHVAYGKDNYFLQAIPSQSLLAGSSWSIAPGEYGCPHAYVVAKKVTRCQIEDFPTKGSRVVLYVGTAEKK